MLITTVKGLEVKPGYEQKDLSFLSLSPMMFFRNRVFSVMPWRSIDVRTVSFVCAEKERKKQTPKMRPMTEKNS